MVAAPPRGVPSAVLVMARTAYRACSRRCRRPLPAPDRSRNARYAKASTWLRLGFRALPVPRRPQSGRGGLDRAAPGARTAAGLPMAGTHTSRDRNLEGSDRRARKGPNLEPLLQI